MVEAASHILVTGPDADEKCGQLRELIRRTVDFPAGVGLEEAFAKVGRFKPPRTMRKILMTHHPMNPKIKISTNRTCP